MYQSLEIRWFFFEEQHLNNFCKCFMCAWKICVLQFWGVVIYTCINCIYSYCSNLVRGLIFCIYFMNYWEMWVKITHYVFTYYGQKEGWRKGTMKISGEIDVRYCVGSDGLRSMCVCISMLKLTKWYTSDMPKCFNVLNLFYIDFISK